MRRMVRWLRHQSSRCWYGLYDPTPPDILTSTSIKTMITPSTTLPRPTDPDSQLSTDANYAVNYAKGWAVGEGKMNRDNRWHSGELPGTVTYCWRTTDRYCCAVLANSRHDATYATTTQMRNDIDQLFWSIKEDVEGGKSPDLVWPMGTPL
jgi:hypothetical protein